MLSRRQFGLALAGSLVASPALAQAWRTYTNPRFGTTIDYPVSFRPGRPSDNGDGLGFTDAQGASFSIHGGHNALDHDLAGLEAFVRGNLDAGRRITYSARGPQWFVLSGTTGGMTFYDRHLISHGGRIVNGLQMLYSSARQQHYGPIVSRMSRSLRAGRGTDTGGDP